MTLGGIPSLPSSSSSSLSTSYNFAYTPIISEDFFSVHMDDFLINGTSLGLPSKVYNSKYVINICDNVDSDVDDTYY